MRQFFLLAAKVTISAALFFLALREIDIDAVVTRINQISLGWIIFTIAATVAQLLLMAIRWREIAKHCNASLPIGRAFRYTMIGAFFSLTLPSTIGGDAVRLWLISRNGTGWRAATYSVLIDRAIGFIALGAVALISLPWSFAVVSNEQGRIALALIASISVCAGAGFLVLGRLTWSWLREWWAIKHIHACAEIANRVLADGASGLWVISLSVMIPVLAGVIAWSAARSIGASAGFFQIFLIILPVTLVTMMPISIAGWGVREAAMMVGFGYAGLPPADGLITSLLYGATAFAVGTSGGLIWILSPEKAERRTNPSIAEPSN